MIKEYMNQPYPLTGNRWTTILSISIFVGWFIVVFQPFGISGNNNLHTILFCLGYGFVTLFTLIIDLFLIPLLFPSLFVNRRWTVLKQIVWLLFILFSIGLGNFTYTSVLTSSWSWHHFLMFQIYTSVVGILPVVFLTIVQQNMKLSQYLKTAQEMNSALKSKHEISVNDRICLIADNEKDRFETESSNLIYIESSGNYIEIFYKRDEKLKSTLLRSTLKRTEEQLQPYSSIVKCHRAFLVNTGKITGVKGNSQGLRLIMENTETEIPVSRNFSKDLKTRLSADK
jgi:hypothetical protein